MKGRNKTETYSGYEAKHRLYIYAAYILFKGHWIISLVKQKQD